jgi:SAM-dependent methyltransferase
MTGSTLSVDLEDADCPMCGAAERLGAYSLPPYAVVTCARCSFHYLSPRPPEAAMLEMYSSSEYYEGGEIGYDSYGVQELALRATFRRTVRELVRSGFAGGDLLEVGCGYGYMLEEAGSAFRHVTGTEYSRRAAASARERGLDVVTGGTADLPPDASFDCVISAHVVEHVYDPPSFVSGLVELLRPGGVLVLATPDMGSLWRRAMGSRWPSFKLPEHVVYFDRPSLQRLLTGAGLEDVRPFPYPHAFPLALIVSKLGLPGELVGRLGGMPIWLPATTLALSARQRRQPAEG